VLATNEKGIKEAADEEVFIDEVNRFCGITNKVKITETGRTHFLDFHEKEIFVNSGVDVYSAYWQEPLRRKMEEKGIRVSLSGYLGDEAITHQGKYYFYEFLEEGKYYDFLKSSFQKGYYSLPLKMLIRNLLPEPLKKIVNKDHKAVYKRISYLLDTEFESKLIAEDKRIPIIKNRSYKNNIIDLVTRRYPFQRIQSESSFGIMHRLEPRYPFADIRLLSFFLSVPAHIIGNPHVSRFFYRTSMKGIIPELILNRNDKSIPAGIFLGKESRGNSDMIKKWLEGISQDHSNPYLKKIDIGKMLAGLDPVNAGDANRQFFSISGSFKLECLVKYFQDLSA
jgi:asparagine synthase (glutamine-hydrolysing)